MSAKRELDFSLSLSLSLCKSRAKIRPRYNATTPEADYSIDEKKEKLSVSLLRCNEVSRPSFSTFGEKSSIFSR